MKIITSVISLVIFLGLSVISNKSLAASATDIVTGYDDCSIVDRGDGMSRLSMRIDFNSADGRVGEGTFRSRMLIMYSRGLGYQANFDGNAQSGAIYVGPGYSYVHGETKGHPWTEKSAVSVRVTVDFINSMFDSESRITLSAGNLSTSGLTHDSRVVSVARNNVYGCFVTSAPGTSPPKNIDITVSAPDWHLGEIKPGQQTSSLSGSSEQVCLRYTGSDVVDKQFIINATNQHGIKNNFYQMKHLHNSSHAIPYILFLNGTSGETILLPNSYNNTVPLNTSGTTCFMPTFLTMAPDNLEPGLYTDVLTFNIVTKA